MLAHFGVCDLLLRLSERPRLIVPCWSSEVLAEVRRVQTGKLGWPTDLADSFNASLHAAFPDAVVSDYQGLIATLTNDQDMVAALRALHETGYPRMVVPDHVPAVAGDTTKFGSWGYALGYMRGLMQSL